MKIIMQRFGMPFLLISSLLLCALVYSVKTSTIEKNLTTYIESQMAGDEKLFNCIDEIVIERVNGTKESTIFTQLHPVKVYSSKNMYVANSNKLVLKELDKTCGGN